MIQVDNTQACFVLLWRKLEHTRRLLAGRYKRFCIRNVLKTWYGVRATDEFIWQVCSRTVVGDEQVCGNDQLPPPSLYPRKHRELLRAIVATQLGIGLRQVKLSELDAAYSIAFPNSTPINVNKKKRNRCCEIVTEQSGYTL